MEPDGSLVTYIGLTGLSAYPWNEFRAYGRGKAYVNYVDFGFPGEEFVPGIVALVNS